MNLSIKSLKNYLIFLFCYIEIDFFFIFERNGRKNYPLKIILNKWNKFIRNKIFIIIANLFII